MAEQLFRKAKAITPPKHSIEAPCHRHDRLISIIGPVSHRQRRQSPQHHSQLALNPSDELWLGQAMRGPNLKAQSHHPILHRRNFCLGGVRRHTKPVHQKVFRQGQISTGLLPALPDVKHIVIIAHIALGLQIADRVLVKFIHQNVGKILTCGISQWKALRAHRATIDYDIEQPQKPLIGDSLPQNRLE